ncbi:hypothetical protein [Leuconostoc rapi]|uniref:hypothetical protein n=1 Tax=Leuconostoc rapi TaxID=1406906 RepID=UPI00195A6405|nr:hypothetical protein [Leuconostoc rapi]MBM7435696.1 hypothetical protein [Leuconostoc rapi]
MEKQDHIVYQQFSSINVNDNFFDSLRNSYSDFNSWFQTKASQSKKAYVSYDDDQHLIAFLFLKTETGPEPGVSPVLDGNRIKIGTFKVDWNHHSALGKRLLAIAMRKFAFYSSKYSKIYVTLFENEKTKGLKKLLELYGFDLFGTKNKDELVFVKNVPSNIESNPFKIFPFISQQNGTDYLLAVLPKFHSLMFGDVNLQSEKDISVPDTSSINNIEKVYLSASVNSQLLTFGDHLIAYRMTDYKGSAYYRSVTTSVGTVIEVKNLSNFVTFTDFEQYVKNKSVFSSDELSRFWKQRTYPWVIKFLYNFSFEKYPNREKLLNNNIINEDQRIVVQRIEKKSFIELVKLGETNESFIID